ncbi:MAG: SRPBCC family protein [Chloroflexia bacterium]
MPKRTIAAEPNQHSIVATVHFNAPRDLVYKLLTDPNLIPDWWGPEGLTTTVDKMDTRPGGSWRYIVAADSGKEWRFHGVYHALETPNTIVSTHEYEDEPGHVSLESLVLTDSDGGTKMTTTSVFQSVEDRDNMLKSDFQDGEQESLNRLEKLLDSMLIAK